MTNLDFAIVIPTLNEEKYIGNLLDSIADQSLQPKEVVIVDAYSQDKTIEEVKKRQKVLPQLRYYQIPKYTISRQRNYGANKTKSEHILFIDADVELKDSDLLEKYAKDIQEKNPDGAAPLYMPLSRKIKDNVAFQLFNSVVRMTLPVWPIVAGINIYVKRSMFNKIHGFDEGIRVGEDMQFIQKIMKHKGKFIFFDNIKVYTSVRRFRKTGYLGFVGKMCKSVYYVHKYGWQNNPIEYPLGNHK